MKRISSLVLTTAVLALFAVPALASVEHKAADPNGEYAEELQGYVPGADALEGKIMAPCCWTQTIDIHGSEVSLELRREIRKRLRAGETADTIQASLVERYGEKILAIPPSSPLPSVATALLVVMGGVGAAGFFMVRGWRRNARNTPAKKRSKKDATDASEERLDARLNAELSELDD